MMKDSKIALSEAEQQLMADAAIILTKQSILTRIDLFFCSLSINYQIDCEEIKDLLPEEFRYHPKVSRGEKYRLLPWLMLDYPRCFDKNKGQLAIRSFFWWGNYFSITLQLTGIYKETVLRYFEQSNGLSLSGKWLAGLTQDLWNNDLPDQNWLPLNFKAEDFTTLKIAKRFEFDQLDQMENLYKEAFKDLIHLLERAFRPPAGETNP